MEEPGDGDQGVDDQGERAGGDAAAEGVAVVGHEPTLHELVSYLLTGDAMHAQVEFRKGSIARLEVGPPLRPGSATLRWLLPPKVLRALS